MASERPNYEHPESPRSERAADEHSNQSEPPISPSLTGSQSPPAPPGHNAPHKPHRDWHDYITLGVEILGVIFLIAYTTFAALQWSELKRATDASTRATNIASEALKSNNDSFQKTFRQMQAQTDEARRMAEEAKRQADIAKDSLRPWVGVTNYTCDCSEANDTFRVDNMTVAVTNSGRTPAIEMAGRFVFTMRKWNEPAPDYDDEARRKHREFTETMGKVQPSFRRTIEKNIAEMNAKIFPEGGVLAPGATNVHIAGSGMMFGREPKIEDRFNNRQIIYLLGNITYSDTLSRRKHRTTVCLMYDPLVPRVSKFSYCPKGQNMD